MVLINLIHKLHTLVLGSKGPRFLQHHDHHTTIYPSTDQKFCCFFAYISLSLPLFSLQIKHTPQEHNPTQNHTQFSLLVFGKKKKHLGTASTVSLISFNDSCNIFRRAELVSVVLLQFIVPNETWVPGISFDLVRSTSIQS